LNNRDLIIKTARRLDKFTLDEMVVVSGVDEQELEEILSDLVSKKIILKNNNTYFFNINNSENKEANDETIIIEKEEGYEHFLTLNTEVQERIRKYVELLNFINKSGINLKQGIELFNQTAGYKKISPSTFTRVQNKFKKYGFKGILPAYSTTHIESALPEELFTYFKKYYLTKEKLSAADAIFKAQKQLQAEQKIEQPYAYNSNIFLRKLRAEFTPEQIEYFRNNVNPPKDATKIKNKIQEPLDMLFKNAAKIYFDRLKAENHFEHLMHQKTDYKNHLKEYFGNLQIKEITNKVVAKYKQKEFDAGYQLASVNIYILILKRIINEVCPSTNYLASRKKKLPKNAYAMDMNLLSEEQISKLLDICYKKYSCAYPVLYLSLSTGASIPELLGLTWDRIDFNNCTISLKYFLYGNKLIMNKCNSTMRKLKINTDISDMLKIKYYDLESVLEDFVFKFDTDKPAQQYIEEDVLAPISEELGITQLHPSDMQHNFVNMCIKQNIPLTFIQKSLGYYGIVNFIKTYRNLIEKLDKGYYNPLTKI